MPRKRYNPRTKAAIVEAATAARKSGKTWKQAFEAAKEKGYTGSTPALVKMMNYVAGKGRKRRGRKPGRKPAAVPIQKRGPGRPPKAKVGRSKGTGSIGAMIDRLVRERVRGVLDRAIAVLQQAKK
jgi:hypothetical protein